MAKPTFPPAPKKGDDKTKKPMPPKKGKPGKPKKEC